MPKDALRCASRMQTALDSGPEPNNGSIAARCLSAIASREYIMLCIPLLAQGILGGLGSETTKCFLFHRTLDCAITKNYSQHWHGITQRVGSRSSKRCASFSCPHFLHGNHVVRGSLPTPSKCHKVVGKVVVVT